MKINHALTKSHTLNTTRRFFALLGLVTLGLMGLGITSGEAQTNNFDSGNDSAWTHYDLGAVGLPASTYSFPPDGSGGYAYRIFSPAPPVATFGPAVAFSYRTNVYSDFFAAVDLAAWDNTLNQDFGLAVTYSSIGVGTMSGYVVGYVLSNSPPALVIDRVQNEQPTTNWYSSIVLDPTHKYRLVVTGKGAVLTAAIYDLSNLTTPLTTVTANDATYSNGVCGLFVVNTVNVNLVNPITNSPAGNADATFDNYLVASNQPTPVLTWTNPPAITYGTVLDSHELNATANVPGSFHYILPVGLEPNWPVPNAGLAVLAVSFTPFDEADYSSAVDTVELTVMPAPLTATPNNATRTFGQPNPAFTGTISGVTNNDSIGATFNCSAVPSSPTGTYAIVPTLLGAVGR